jgi:ATP-dependent DNA helicase RecQ
MPSYKKRLKKYFGFSKFRKNQKKIINAVLKDNKDVCTIMFTGAGKSLCYQFPAVFSKKTVIVISPLISLMKDQTIKLENSNIKSVCLNSTVSDKEKIKKKIIKNKYRLVYTTPEYIINQEEFLLELYNEGNLLMIAVDESHCVSSWGHDFRPSYKEIQKIKLLLPDIPLMALTATATPKVQEDIINTLRLNDPYIVKTTFDRPNLKIRLYPKDKIITDLLPLVSDNKTCIIYCQTRKDTEKISQKLSQKGIKCDAYHAGLASVQRDIIQEDFIYDNITCIVATIAFGMGIDKTVRRVIHYGVSKDMESYYQEIGRAGRDGLEAECILFHGGADFNTSSYFINKIENITYRNHKMDLLSTMKKYVYSNECRRKLILEYFGESYKNENCKMCDNCLNTNDSLKVDFTFDTILLLDAVYKTGNMFGMNSIINILRGCKRKNIIKFKLFPFYGKGSKHSEKWWKIFFRMIINQGFLKEKAISKGHGTSIYRSNKGFDFLKNICIDVNKLQLKKNYEKLYLNVPDEMRDFYEVKVKKNNSLEEDQLFKLLLELRKDISKKENIKPSLIFNDKTLYEMVKLKPTNQEEFLNIDGVDKLRCQKYGSDFIELILTISDFFDEPIISKKEKKNTKEVTYELFQNNKKSVKEISILRNIQTRTVEDHLVSLFKKSYKLDLDRLGFDDNVYNIIKDTLKNNEDDLKLKSIKDRLPKSISYLHIKLTLVKMKI